ncbi:MAG: hypothetical protein ABIY50_06175 [Ignavibacteria bacterium]
MKNNRLIQLLKSLTPSEFKQFKEFVNSPFYNKNKNVISLFDYLKNFYPDFKNEKVNDEFAFRKLFPGEKYDYFKLKNIISDLLMLGKEFIGAVHFLGDEDMKTKVLLEQYRIRSLDTMHEQLYRASLKKLDDSGIRDEFYFQKLFYYSEELKSYYSPKHPNSNFDLFQDQLNYFVKYSIIKMLRLYNTMLHENKQNNYEFDLKMFDEVFHYIENNKDESNPTMIMYYYIILLEKENDEKYFFQLKRLFETHYNEFSHFDKYMYYLHMSGFCADVFNNKCRTDFTTEHFHLSKENFERGTIKLGKILYLDFLNHVKIAVRVDEYEWAEMYMEQFKNLLSDEHRQNTLNFCYGYINYKKGNLEKALDLLSRANFSNFIIKVQVKILLLHVYYELGYYEQALAMIDTFRHYIQREKGLLDDYRQSFNEYLRIINELIKIGIRIDEKGKTIIKNKIKKEIENIKYNQFGIKLWLIEKVKELK